MMIDQYPQTNSNAYRNTFSSLGYDAHQANAPLDYIAFRNRSNYATDVPADATMPAPYPSESQRPETVVQALASERLRFRYLNRGEVKYLLESRQKLRDRNHSEIMGRISDVTGQASCWRNLGLRENANQLMTLEKMKADLEGELRQEEVSFWKDTLDLRKQWIEVEQQYRASKRRADLFSVAPEYHD